MGSVGGRRRRPMGGGMAGSLARGYVAVSCFAFAGLLGGAGFLLAAAALVPEWVQDLGRDASSLLARAGGAGPGTEPAPAAAAVTGSMVDPIGDPAADSVAPTSGARYVRAAASIADVGHPSSYPGGVGGLHTTLRELERDIARWKDADPDLAAKLEAWERIRGPLLDLLESLTGSGVSVRCGRDAELGAVDIRTVAGEIAGTLAALAESERERARSLLGRLDGRTLLRLLLDDGSVSDAEAIEYLRAFSAPEAHLVLDRLARLVPDRAARLLRYLTGPGRALLPPEGSRSVGDAAAETAAQGRAARGKAGAGNDMAGNATGERPRFGGAAQRG